MALTPERIMELSDRLLRVVGAGYVRPQDAEEFARTIEAEVRKEYTELILQLVEALGVATTPLAQDRQEVLRALAAGRARLEGKP